MTMTEDVVKYRKQKQRDKVRKKAAKAMNHLEAGPGSDDLKRTITHDKEVLKHRERAKKFFRHE